MATPAYVRQWWAPRRWWSAARARLLSREKTHPFDRAYGVDTDGLIYADAAAEGHAGARHNAGYYATAPSLFRGAIELWRGTLAGTRYALEDYTLVDIGCGKGRVLMMAAAYPFREIVGVELNPALAQVARNNLSRVGRRRWLGLLPPKISLNRVPQVPRNLIVPELRGNQQGRVPQVLGPHERVDVRGVEDRGAQGQVFGPGVEVSILRPGKAAPRVRIIQGDALTVPLPDGPAALFYFNSFEREMTQMWLARLAEIARDRTHPLDLIYIHPEFDQLVRQVPGMQAVAEAEIPFSKEDAAADVFGVKNDSCAIYRHSPDYSE